MRLESVIPHAFAEPASRILQEAWQPPCLRYSAEYLRWQFSFPGTAGAVGVAAFDGAEPTGFLACLPGTVHFRGRAVRVGLLCFGAVRPRWRGLIAVALYRKLAAVLREVGLPVVAFAQKGSTAEQVLVATFKAAKFQWRPFGEYPTYGRFARADRPVPGYSCTEAQDATEFLAVVRRCTDARVVWNYPGSEQLGHYRKDPRRRALVLLRNQGGEPLGAAMVIRSEIITPQGVEFVSTIDNLFLPEPSSDLLRALLPFAGTHYADQVTSPVVTAPNLYGIDPAALCRAGFRATPSCFRGHLFAGDAADPLPGAEGTNYEIFG
jgi:hypothetical protein